jgi:putative heme-binding domain-containing protein
VRERLADASTPVAERRRAVDLLRRAGDTESSALLVKLLEDPQLRSAVIPLLANSADSTIPASAAGLIAQFNAFSAADRTAALATLTSKPAFALALLRAVESGSFEKKNLTALHARQLRNLRNAEVTRALDRVWGRTAEASTDAKAAIMRFRDVYRNAPLWSYDAKAGHQHFERLCSACHAMDATATAGKLGPNLNGTWRNGLDYFLENIIDPNAVIPNDYRAWNLETTDERSISGILKQQDDKSVTLVTANETLVVPRNEIRSLKEGQLSMMPEGLLQPLEEQEVRDLIYYLRGPGQAPLIATTNSATAFFNGKDLTGWEGEPGLWKVEAGEIVGRSSAGLSGDTKSSACSTPS